MPRNTSGLRRGGPGRPKGRPNQVPGSFKRALVTVFTEIHRDNPALMRQTLERGLRAEPPKSFPYLQLYLAYQLGKPVEKVELRQDATEPAVIVIYPPDGATIPDRPDLSPDLALPAATPAAEVAS